MKFEITSFEIWGLFDEFHHILSFSDLTSDTEEARIAILIGRNGIGKTTLLNMIDGMLKADFDIFREVPFEKCRLSLSSGDTLSIDFDNTVLTVAFNDTVAHLDSHVAGAATSTDYEGVERFKVIAQPILSQVRFEKLDIHRSTALRQRAMTAGKEFINEPKKLLGALRKSLEGKNAEACILSDRIKHFVREALIDYKKFFSSETPELFPKIFDGLQRNSKTHVTLQDLIARLDDIKNQECDMRRFGLTTENSDIEKLLAHLATVNVNAQSEASLAALEAYVEIFESKHDERQLLTFRLKKFESLVNEFLDGKTIQIDYEYGLHIQKHAGQRISELQLSSGEYHLLYMMVAALVSTRTGTTIAIDEPELSLHIGWQRRLVSALAQCASGASPLLIFATHSPAIGAEYQDAWIELN